MLQQRVLTSLLGNGGGFQNVLGFTYNTVFAPLTAQHGSRRHAIFLPLSLLPL
jgi:hypothetical protein